MNKCEPTMDWLMQGVPKVSL